MWGHNPRCSLKPAITREGAFVFGVGRGRRRAASAGGVSLSSCLKAWHSVCRYTPLRSRETMFSEVLSELSLRLTSESGQLQQGVGNSQVESVSSLHESLSQVERQKVQEELASSKQEAFGSLFFAFCLQSGLRAKSAGIFLWFLHWCCFDANFT